MESLVKDQHLDAVGRNDVMDKINSEGEKGKNAQELVEGISVVNKEGDDYNETKDVYNTDSNDKRSSAIIEKEAILNDEKNHIHIEIIHDEEDLETDGQETDTDTTAKIQTSDHDDLYETDKPVFVLPDEGTPAAEALAGK
jgi:hypothetical protein